MKPSKKEILETFAAPSILGVITTIANWIIPNPLVRSITIGVLLFGIFLALLLPQLRRFLHVYMAVSSLNKFVQRTTILHQLVHQGRDLCVRIMPEAEPYSPPPSQNGETAHPHPVLVEYKATITSLLEHVTRIFQMVAPPDTKVWACIRDRRADDCYHTFQRAGNYVPRRADTSNPMHKARSKTIKRLRDSYESGMCVIITGSSKGPQMWEHQPNDQFGEDRCVLMGAVMTKSRNAHDSEWIKAKHAWVLSVCADRDDAFTESHIPLMQCCVDVFSTIANTMTRRQH